MANVQHIYTGTQDPIQAGLSAADKNGHHYTDTSTGNVFTSNGDAWLMVAVGASRGNLPFVTDGGAPTATPAFPSLRFDTTGDGTNIYIAAVTISGIKWVKLSGTLV